MRMLKLAALAAFTIIASLSVSYAADKSQTPAKASRFDPNAPCVYDDDADWKHWGAAPYGPTSSAALSDEKIDWWLKCSSLPGHLRSKAKAQMQANPNGQRLMYVTPDMTLPEMASAADRDHKTQFIMRDVKVARIQVAFGIVKAAEVPVWDIIDDNGDVYTVGDPFVCGNLSIILIKRLDCVIVEFDASRAEFVRHNIGSGDGEMPASECNAIEQFDDQGHTTGWKAWYGECDDCITDLSYYRRYYGKQTTIPHKFFYKVIYPRQRIRYHRAVHEKSVGICQQAPDGHRSCGVYVHPVGPDPWNGRTYVRISNNMWLRDNGNCPQ